MKISIEYEVGDQVKLPFDQEGVIIKILDLPWGHPYEVEITKSTLSAKGDKELYKKEQLDAYNIGEVK